MLLAVLGQLGCRALIPSEILRDSNDLVANFLQTFGGIYGVIVAFAIYVVWQEHNETQVTIEREAVSLAELSRMLGSLTSWPQCGDVRAWLIEYAHVVPQTNGKQPTQGRARERALLDRAFARFLAYAPTGAQEIRFYDSALSLFRQLNESREHRYTIAALRLPTSLRWFVFLGGAITVGSMWLTWLEAEAIQALLTAGMTWVVVAAYTIVTDLDDPYHGDFVVNWQRFHEVAERMRTIPCPSQLDATSESAE
jgi:hypothetical protein